MYSPRFLVLAACFGLLSVARADLSKEQLETLFDPKLSEMDLERATAEAAHVGVSAQVLSEAKLVWGLRHQENAFLAKILPELEETAKHFSEADSVAIGKPQDFEGLVNYVRALVALQKGDEDGFKKSITEAFWLSPHQSQLFADTIIEQRRQKKMSSMKLDLTVPFTTSTGKQTTLAEQMGKNKALLLDYWATWCPVCMAAMPELDKRAAYLSEHNVAVSAMNLDDGEAAAEKVRTDKQMKLPWLVEPKDRPFAGPLEISSLPSVVLIAPDGKILYNGHPKDAGLWAALKTLDASIEPLKESE